MKALKKLALVSAVSMISAGAFAMEAMDDESMSATTGQDGISILVSPGNKSITTLQALGVTNETINQIGQYANGTGGAADDVFTPAVQGVDLNGDGDFVDAGETAPVASFFTATGASDISKGLFLRQVVIHDDDGIGTNKNSGSLLIGSGALNDSTVVFAKGDAPIEINIDMVGDVSATVGNQSMLNVEIKTPTLAIKTGAVYVSNSNAAAAGIDKDGAASATGEVDGSSQDGGTGIKIANASEIVLGATTINIQLGSESQTLFGGAETAANPSAMILVAATITNGLVINNSSLIDAGGVITGGEIGMKSLKIVNNGGTDLDALVAVNVENTITDINPAYTGPGNNEGGLVVTLGGLGSKGVDGFFGTADDAGADVTITNTKLGSAANAKDLGDVQILGLQLGGTSLIIRGH